MHFISIRQSLSMRQRLHQHITTSVCGSASCLVGSCVWTWVSNNLNSLSPVLSTPRPKPAACGPESPTYPATFALQPCARALVSRELWGWAPGAGQSRMPGSGFEGGWRGMDGQGCCFPVWSSKTSHSFRRKTIALVKMIWTWLAYWRPQLKYKYDGWRSGCFPVTFREAVSSSWTPSGCSFWLWSLVNIQGCRAWTCERSVCSVHDG